MSDLDLTATMGILGRGDIQPVRIEVDAVPPCGLSAEFGAATMGRISATIGGIPAGTLVVDIRVVAVHGEELARFGLGRVIADGECVGLMLDANNWRWTAV